MSHRPVPAARSFLAVLLIGVLLAGCSLCKKSGAPVFSGDFTPSSGPLRAGAAAVEIVLPNGTALAGFGAAPRRATDGSALFSFGPLLPGGCLDPDPSTAAVLFTPNTGTRDPLTARALVLDNGARRLAIVKIDAIGMSRRLRDAVAAAAGSGPLPIPAAHVAVVATHTHSGPAGVADQIAWQIIASDCYSQAVFEAVRSAAVQALEAARAALVDAQLGVNSTHVAGISRNRRPQPYAPGPAPLDTELALIKVVTTGGTPIAALFNFAIHGTWYDDQNLQFSADVMGAMERQVQLATGAVAIFTNGAEGDVAPQKSAALDTVDKVGALVAGEVLALWNATATTPTADLRAVFTDIAMPAPRYNPVGCLPLGGSSTTLCDLMPGGAPPTLPLPRWVSTTLPFQALRINDTVLVAVPGEPVTELGTAIRDAATAAGLGRGYVLAVANDHGGYFTTTTQYDLATYEGAATLYGRDTGARVVASAGLVIDKVK